MTAIKSHFERAVFSYRQAATIQNTVAERLVQMIAPAHYPLTLEIGCGDGLFSEKLRDQVVTDQLIALDIAYSPLQNLQPHIADLRIQADAEALPLRNQSVDLLVSSSSLQWFRNPQHSLPQLLDCLRPGGQFYFSLFCRGTFTEMTEVCQSCDFGHTYPLPGEKDILSILSRDKRFTVSMQAETLSLHFPDVISFLQMQKATGATFSGAKSFSGRRQLQRFIETYQSRYATEKGIPVSYRIAYFEGQFNNASQPAV